MLLTLLSLQATMTSKDKPLYRPIAIAFYYLRYDCSLKDSFKKPWTEASFTMTILTMRSLYSVKTHLRWLSYRPVILNSMVQWDGVLIFFIEQQLSLTHNWFIEMKLRCLMKCSYCITELWFSSSFKKNIQRSSDILVLGIRIL